jgi:hypothetical protein
MLENSNNTIMNLGKTCNSQFCLLSPKVREIEPYIQYTPSLDIPKVQRPLYADFPEILS